MRGRIAPGWPLSCRRLDRASGRIGSLAIVLLFSTLAAVPGLAVPDRTIRSSLPTPPGLDPRVLDLALQSAARARDSVAIEKPSLLTIIDYSRPSTEPRLWVLDLERSRVLFTELVAHGRGSGENHATRFSNRPGSHQSSLGLFLTLGTYTGRNGYSLRMQGLEPGINDRALERAIVMHGAPYVSAATSKALGRLGRSWGCPALSLDIARDVIDTIKHGSLVFAYYPDSDWLLDSPFLGCGDTPLAATATSPTAPNTLSRH